MKNDPFSQGQPRKRIALLAANLNGGGAERSLVNLGIGLTELGHEVEFVLFQKEGPYLSLVPPSAKIVDLQIHHARESLPKLIRYFRANRPDAIFSILDHVNVVAVMGQMISRVPTRVCVSIRSTLSRESAAMGRKKKIEMWLASKLYPKAHKVIAVSEGVANDTAQFLRISPDHIEVLYNPVITPDFLETFRQLPDHPWLLKKELPVVIGVGRLTLAKDFDVLIEAFSEVIKVIPSRLIIFGEGEDRAKLEALIKSKGIEGSISLPGFTLNPYAAMSACDVFVLSSQFEGLPGALIQAMACGAILVSTDCKSGPREILEDGKWGRLVPVGNVGKLSEAIVAALEDAIAGRSKEIPQEVISKYGYIEATKKCLEIMFG